MRATGKRAPLPRSGGGSWGKAQRRDERHALAIAVARRVQVLCSGPIAPTEAEVDRVAADEADRWARGREPGPACV